MKRRIFTILVGIALALGAAAAPTFAGQPPGQRGYEGQPGNQGGASGQPASGQQGYEGQPGNQGGH